MIIADTGFWVGLFNASDHDHEQCKSFLSKCREPLITTTPVLTETTHLLIQRRHPRIAYRFLELFTAQRKNGFVQLFDIQAQHLDRQCILVRQYESLPMDFADASLVILAEHLGHGRIVSTDRRDFDTYRWKNRHPFRNLLMQ
uniref:PIN domain-containing protein n=1 Tax=Candidatus Kentrum sp. FM TaxID=2126340 RepID=A0A450RYX3_9GAMM|nr:MAG: hypothetical protein BECKFM1743C_GA0114222_1001114 [Candidatus Kentron sp. FM]VFJ53269.1 MAG: hypothetical protein BECKFM1743A_GA0114220_101128 [Candidatus Kentron sp. FM]VFK10095.1 MAG: hypothetical protein BECKFM1743B_GA0114221_101298 [Candidatus Kentron sp. FM]